jgi:uncharacterized coiled-coil protein SlyX
MKQQGNLIAPIIVAIGVIIAAIVFAVVTTLLETADSGADLRLTRLEQTLATETGARLRLEAELATSKADVAQLRDEMSLLANRAPVAPPQPLAEADGQTVLQLPDEGETDAPPTEALTEQMKLAKARFNKGVTQPNNKIMMALLGPPRDSYNTDCQPVSNPSLKAILDTRTIGPIKITMLKPALESIERVLNRLKESDPDIYAKVGTAGAICARFIRGSNTAVSNHSWGTAIDLTLEGQLDPFADGGTQFGLLILAEYFNDEGWFWGAAYNREDSMHFEVGAETLQTWAAAGLLAAQ